jgi:glycosyltransferase involved in cell wall biosynthesis
LKILLVSHQYYPVLGGVPEITRLLALGFRELNYAVRLITATESTGEESDLFEVYRRPSPWRLLKLYGWADYVVMVGPSIRSGWPALLTGKPCLVSHHAGMPMGRLQWALVKKSKNVACSHFLAEKIGHATVGIANPYDGSVFYLDRSIPKERDFIYVGRLSHEKGVDLMLLGLAELRKQGMVFKATIVGGGKEEQSLRKLANKLGIREEVEFTGPLFGKELAAKIRGHRIGVIPSRCEETFGIVALEFIACGLPVVAARVGGLPDAVGPCGLYFESGHQQELAKQMEKLLADEHLRNQLNKGAKSHLEYSSPAHVANEYIKVLLS